MRQPGSAGDGTLLSRSLSCGVFSACLFALAAAPALAQDALVAGPKAVATEFLNAVTAQDWPTVIRLTDEQSLWEYTTERRREYRHWRDGQPVKPTVEDLMQRDSLMPRAVAQYYVSQYERSLRKNLPGLLMQLADVENPAQVDSLTDQQLFVRRLRAKLASYQTQLAVRRAGCIGVPTAEKEPTRVVRGVALLSDTEAVALYEEDAGIPALRALSGTYAQLDMRRTKLGWRVVASENLLGGAMPMWVAVTICPTESAPH